MSGKINVERGGATLRELSVKVSNSKTKHFRDMVHEIKEKLVINP